MDLLFLDEYSSMKWRVLFDCMVSIDFQKVVKINRRKFFWLMLTRITPNLEKGPKNEKLRKGKSILFRDPPKATTFP